MSCKRCYIDGPLTTAKLVLELDNGFALTHLVKRGHSGGDVAYFRHATPEEIADCRSRMAAAAAKDSARVSEESEQ